MNESTERRALTAFTPTLVAAVVCIAMFLLLLAASISVTPLRNVATEGALAIALLLHRSF